MGAAVTRSRPGETEDTVESPYVAQGQGSPAPGERRAHTQSVLDVDQPALESEKLSDPDQLIGHCPVRALVPGQEGLAEPLPFFPLGDESPCGTGEKRGRSDLRLGSPLTQRSPRCGSCPSCKLVSVPRKQENQIPRNRSDKPINEKAGEAPPFPGGRPPTACSQSHLL